jgi:DNA invertase Pin-like site-specific DNA recombinase
MRQAIGYTRVSTERQAEEGLGLDVQAQLIREHAKSAGLRLHGIVEDAGVSGAVEDRPGLADLMERLAPGVVVVVPRLDRLARDLLTQEFLLRDIRKRGADVVSCSRAEADYLSDDPEDPTRKLIRQVLGAVSEFERAMIRLRLARGRRAKAARGGFAYGAPPYGTRAEDGGLAPEPAEADAVSLARTLHGRGDSLRAICRALDAAGFRPRRSAQWHPQVVARIVARP